ncbi:hypothetical protein LLG95_08380 [bacterium]|nr:hypothetical protein [bacterium]
MKYSFVIAGIILIAAIVYWGESRTAIEEPPDQFMAKMAAEAVSIAQEEFFTELDHSVGSVREVEDILGKLHKRYAVQSKKSGMETYAIVFGAYIGETLKRHAGRGHWERNHPAGGKNSWPLFLEDGDRACFPCLWCIRRIENGDEDNVWVKTQLELNKKQKTLNHVVRPGPEWAA